MNDRKSQDVGTHDELSPFAGINHARFHAADVVYHVLFRAFQGRFLLRPDKGRKLESLIQGIIGRAQELFEDVHLFADAFLSNHAHLLLRGSPEQIPVFVGFIKREISRRWGQVIDWPGAMWDEGYESTALPTFESQMVCLRYLLSQGVKEGLVASPLHWPGQHCAKYLATGRTANGVWFDGTAYGRAVLEQKRRRQPQPVRRIDFEHTKVVCYEQLPCWAELSPEDYQSEIHAMVTSIEEEAVRERGGKPVLGVRRVLSMSRDQRSAIAPPPWYENRRRMVYWAKQAAARTQAYLDRYWSFQRAFRVASKALLEGNLLAAFPEGAFRPSMLQPMATAPG